MDGRSPDDRRRNRVSWQEQLARGQKLRVMLKGELAPPVIVTASGVTSISPTYVDVWVCDVDDATAVTGFGRRIIVTDTVIRVAVYDPSLPTTTARTTKDGAYGHVEVIDGIPELTWVGC